jgi:hypothetical protein
MFYPLNYGNISKSEVRRMKEKIQRSDFQMLILWQDCEPRKILRCAIQRIIVISRLRLGTSSLRKTA